MGLASLQDTFAMLRELLEGLSWWQILIISATAGLSEEVLFRGVIQSEWGLLAASVLFGLCHPLSGAYIVYASLLGTYLGLLAKASGSVVAPIVAHAAYDALGLWYLTMRWKPLGGAK
jgi:hypothetical protein